MNVLKQLRQKSYYKCKECNFIGYGINGQVGYHLWDFDTHTKVKGSNVVFNESMVHKKPIMEEKVRKVVLKDFITYTLCSCEVGNFH